MLTFIRSLVPPQPRLAITAIAFNDVVKQRAVSGDGVNFGRVNSLMPFLGILAGLACDGHTVVVFEGHRAALEVGVRGADMLVIDSAMLPLLRKDWGTVTFGAMRKGARIVVHSRELDRWLPVARANSESGWQYAEPGPRAH
jgi:hypothetical protein